MNPGEIQVWLVKLDGLPDGSLPAPSAGELARADRLIPDQARQRYLRAHGALRDILGRFAGARLDFAVASTGKPYLPAMPALRFNLSRSHGMAAVAVALEVDVGVDIERLRPMPECQAIAERFFPPSEAAALADMPAPEREGAFFRRWTRIEARLKATGAGLYGLGVELEGPWTMEDIDAGEGFAAAVAARRGGMAVRVAEFPGGPAGV